MLEKITQRQYSYKVYNTPFCIDIIITGDLYEAWIYLKNYGFKLYMFGFENTNIEDFKIAVCNNIWTYMQEYIDTKDKMEEYSFYD